MSFFCRANVQWCAIEFLHLLHKPWNRATMSNQAELADIFFDLQLWPIILLKSLKQNQCLVPHLKDLFCICLKTKTQGFWMSFKLCNLGSKKPYFNRAYVVSVKTQLHTTVAAACWQAGNTGVLSCGLCLLPVSSSQLKLWRETFCCQPRIERTKSARYYTDWWAYYYTVVSQYSAKNE